MTTIDIFRSVAVLPPSPPAEQPWQPVFWELTRDRGDGEPVEFVRYRRAIFAEIIRREWDKSMKLSPNLPFRSGKVRAMKNEIKLAGAVTPMPEASRPTATPLDS